MYEKLDKLRADLEKAKQKRAEADARVKQMEQRLREAENTQILADVGALKLTPEQLAEFLKLAASGKLPLGQSQEKVVSVVQDSVTYGAENENQAEESEEYEDEE